MIGLLIAYVVISLIVISVLCKAVARLNIL